MKIFATAASILMFASAAAQSSGKPNPAGDAADLGPIYNTAALEIQPEFPGGQSAFKDYFIRSFSRPGTSGKIIATFIVEKDGSLSDIKIVKDTGPGSATLAMQILKDSPKWTPGKQGGKSVRTLMAMPFIIGNK